MGLYRCWFSIAPPHDDVNDIAVLSLLTGCDEMKKSAMLIGNVLIVLTILGFTLFYVNGEHKRTLSSQTEAFKNMTVAMESVTTNYLLGEQEVCNSWAAYMNANDLTAEEAIGFVRESISTPDIMAHILEGCVSIRLMFTSMPKN